MLTLSESAKQALAHVQEFKRRWIAVPPFGHKVNKATREAVSLAHMPVFQLEEVLHAALAQPERTLTDEVIADLWHQNGGFHHHFARAVERYLKGEK